MVKYLAVEAENIRRVHNLSDRFVFLVSFLSIEIEFVL